MANHKMSRDARKVLDSLSKESGRGTSIEDVFIAEEMVYTFYAKTIIGHIKRMYNPNSDKGPHTMAFYYKPTFSLNKGKRTKETWKMTDDHKRAYWAICNGYLIEDFSYDYLQILRGLVDTYKYEDILRGIKISIDEDVRSIPYLLRILERIQAERELQEKRIADRRRLAVVDKGGDVIKRQRIEIASLMNDWQQTIENVELQNKVDRLYKGD